MTKDNDVVIVAAKRTAIGAFMGAFAQTSAVDLGAKLLSGIIAQLPIAPTDIDQLIIGQVLTAGCGQNPARQTALKAGLPETVTGLTINKVCGSGLMAVQLAAQAIQYGNADLVIAGGQENMSRSAYALPAVRQSMRLGHQQIIDTLLHDGLTDAFSHIHMGITAENIAERYQITRMEQDIFSLRSQHNALSAIEKGLFDHEILPITLDGSRNPHTIDRDESPRVTTLEQLSALNPVFKKEGTVTAGNASSINDGAALVVLCRRKKAQQLSLPILATINAFANVGVSPTLMGLGPIDAIRRCLAKSQQSLATIDLFECNEAFAAQAIAVNRELALPEDCVNIHGGAIALGHPIGASGCRILVTLIHQLHHYQLQHGVAALCVGGGEGVAMSISRH